MRKLTVIILIVLVLGVLAGCLFIVLNPSEISYVGDYKVTSSDSNQLLIKRLYSTDIDEEKMKELASSTLATAFTDEEVLEAALKAGKPKYYPWYYFDVTGCKSDSGDIIISGKVNQSFAEGQTAVDFAPSNLRLEAVATGMTISEDSVIYGTNETGDDAEKRVPVLASDGSSMVVELGEAGAYEIILNGTSGSVMLQFTYDISTAGTIIPKTVLTDQLLLVYVYVSTDENGSVTAVYDLVDASKVEEVY